MCDLHLNRSTKNYQNATSICKPSVTGLHYGIKLICRAELNNGALWHCDIMQKFLSVKVGRIALLLPIKRRTTFTSLKVVIDSPHSETVEKCSFFDIRPKNRYKFAISAIKLYPPCGSWLCACNAGLSSRAHVPPKMA